MSLVTKQIFLDTLNRPPGALELTDCLVQFCSLINWVFEPIISCQYRPYTGIEVDVSMLIVYNAIIK